MIFKRKRKIANVETRLCSICSKPYFRRIKGSRNTRMNATIRRSGCMTCSKSCSKKYCRIVPKKLNNRKGGEK